MGKASTQEQSMNTSTGPQERSAVSACLIKKEATAMPRPTARSRARGSSGRGKMENDELGGQLLKRFCVSAHVHPYHGVKTQCEPLERHVEALQRQIRKNDPSCLTCLIYLL